ncbi:MAG: class C sortase, partial [Firmicutes bacterium]|nr:class C sortase [Bacillota bacterium]
MKKIFIVGLLVLLGVGLVFYPKIADYFSAKNASVAVENYAASVSKIDENAIAEELKKAEDYNSALTGEGIHDPFVPGSGSVMGADYLSLLNIDGTMGYLVIPEINVNLPIYHGASEETLRKGVGHLEGTSLPVGGEGTHAVLTGHTGLTNARLFTDLTELKRGDTFYVHVLGMVLAYQVDQIKVVEPADTSDLLPVEGKDYVTLVTCTPYRVNSHRLLVRGIRIPYTPATAQNTAAPAPVMTQENKLLLRAGLITAAAMLALI